MRNPRGGHSSSDWSDWSPKNTTRGRRAGSSICWGVAQERGGSTCSAGAGAPRLPEHICTLILATDIIRLRGTRWDGEEEEEEGGSAAEGSVVPMVFGLSWFLARQIASVHKRRHIGM